MSDLEPAKLLIVDDDDGLLFLMSDILRKEGHTVETLGSGVEAVEWVCENTVDLLLLDLRLNDLPALSLVERLRTRGRDLPFIVITGHGDEKTAAEIMRNGGLDYVMKDAGLLELLPAIVRRGLAAVDRESRLRQLEREVLQASEEERRRIGRDLHDGLGQQLTALEFLVQRLTRQMKNRAPELVGDAEEVSTHIRQAISQVRRLSHGLAPVSLEADGLIVALRDLAQMGKAADLSCEFRTEGDVVIPDPAVTTHLYRIAQEALNNVLKHARASAVRISLVGTDGAIELTIEDDGVGLPEPRNPKSGIGLQVMQHRVSLIGGRLELRSEPGRGMFVRCSLTKTV